MLFRKKKKLYHLYISLGTHSVNTSLLPISGFVLYENSSEMLQNLPYFIQVYENPKLFFPFFISCYFLFFPNECPGLCRQLGKNKVAQNEKQKRQPWVFVYIKYGKYGTFRRAQTLTLGGVYD